MDKIKDLFLNVLKDYPIASGMFMLVLGILWLLKQLGKRESFRMKDHGLGSWGAMVNTWAIIFILIIWGLILILRDVI
ncbi:MAG: hypothetical protein CBB72_012975 [Muricauda sp. TMED12]|nr:MAG: hypothetical protein CBB72_012975 [Muricauda sp. TMED12]